MVDPKNREVSEQILALTDTACQASLELLELHTAGEEKSALALASDLRRVVQAASAAQEPLLPQLEHAYTSEMLENIVDTLEEIDRSIQGGDPERAAMKMEFQFFPFLRQLKEAFHFWGMIYPDPEEMARYYREEFAAHFRNFYVADEHLPAFGTTGRGCSRPLAVALSDTYGPGDRRPKVLNLIRRAILQETALDLTSGRQIYDAVYIDDVAQGFIRAAAALEQPGNAHQFFQLSAENPRSLRKTVEVMLEVNGLNLQANWGGRPDLDYIPGYPLRIFPAPLGWRACMTLEDGLRRFWNSASLEGEYVRPISV